MTRFKRFKRIIKTGKWGMGTSSQTKRTSCCGARNFQLANAHKISTAATPYSSLDLPQAALGNGSS